MTFNTGIEGLKTPALIIVLGKGEHGVSLDTPDPYLILRIKTAPEGRRRTKTKDNEVNPVWNEEFTFFLDGAVDNKLHMILMEANYGSLDQTIGEAWYSLNDLPPNEVVTKSFFFPKDGKSEVELEFRIHEE
uniref:Cytosolic phospholipase A2 n=1 Tax=Magallana gigas TaxID=29159 RepID=K1QBV6_MAGGI